MDDELEQDRTPAPDVSWMIDEDVQIKRDGDGVLVSRKAWAEPVRMTYNVEPGANYGVIRFDGRYVDLGDDFPAFLGIMDAASELEEGGSTMLCCDEDGVAEMLTARIMGKMNYLDPRQFEIDVLDILQTHLERPREGTPCVYPSCEAVYDKSRKTEPEAGKPGNTGWFWPLGIGHEPPNVPAHDHRTWRAAYGDLS